MCHTFKQFKVAASQFAGGAGVEMKSVAAVNQTCGRGDTDKLQLFRKLMHDSVDAGNVFLDILFVEITKFAEEEGDSVQIQISAEVCDDRAQILFVADFQHPTGRRRRGAMRRLEFRRLQSE